MLTSFLLILTKINKVIYLLGIFLGNYFLPTLPSRFGKQLFMTLEKVVHMIDYMIDSNTFFEVCNLGVIVSIMYNYDRRLKKTPSGL